MYFFKLPRPWSPTSASSGVGITGLCYMPRIYFDNLYFPKIVPIVSFLSINSKRIEPSFVLSTVSPASPQTTAASSEYLLCEWMCVGGRVILEKKKEALIPLLIVTHCFQATLGLFSSKTSMKKSGVAKQLELLMQQYLKIPSLGVRQGTLWSSRDSVIF